MRLISSMLFLVLVTSCKKDKPIVQKEEFSFKNGMIVLCEGLYQQNNSSLSWVSFFDASVENDLFLHTVERQLGDTGNDIQRYGNKIYILVNVSSTIEVLDAKTGTFAAQILMQENGTAKQPRSIAFHEGKAYVSCFDGFVDVIDTTTLSVVQRIPVGANPEGIAVSDNHLFVANSGGLNSSGFDSTLSVINLTSMQEETRLTVGKNPSTVVVDAAGDVYVISRGDYVSIPSRMYRIPAGTTNVEHFNFDASGITRMNDQLLVSYYNYTTSQASVSLFDPTTEQLTDTNYLDLSNVETLYGVAYNPANDKIYVSDAKSYTHSGYVHEFSAAGTYERNFHVRLNPSKLLFFQ